MKKFWFQVENVFAEEEAASEVERCVDSPESSLTHLQKSYEEEGRNYVGGYISFKLP